MRVAVDVVLGIQRFVVIRCARRASRRTWRTRTRPCALGGGMAAPLIAADGPRAPTRVWTAEAPTTAQVLASRAAARARAQTQTMPPRPQKPEDDGGRKPSSSVATARRPAVPTSPLSQERVHSGGIATACVSCSWRRARRTIGSGVARDGEDVLAPSARPVRCGASAPGRRSRRPRRASAATASATATATAWKKRARSAGRAASADDFRGRAPRADGGRRRAPENLQLKIMGLVVGPPPVAPVAPAAPAAAAAPANADCAASSRVRGACYGWQDGFVAPSTTAAAAACESAAPASRKRA